MIQSVRFNDKSSDFKNWREFKADKRKEEYVFYAAKDDVIPTPQGSGPSNTNNFK